MLAAVRLTGGLEVLTGNIDTASMTAAASASIPKARSAISSGTSESVRLLRQLADVGPQAQVVTPR